MNPKLALAAVGLEKKEVEIYLALLELGEASVLDISKKANIKRPTAYLALASLTAKGFVSKIIRGNKSYFAPQHPKKLVTESELRLKEMRKIVPQLESLLDKSSGRPKIMIYQGKEELDCAYDEWFVQKGELVYVGTLKLSSEVYPQTYKKMSYLTLSPEIRIRELINESEESRKYAKNVKGPYRLIRFMPREFLPFEADIGIYGNRVFITSVKKEYFTVGIESDEISQVFRTIYDLMWQTAKK